MATTQSARGRHLLLVALTASTGSVDAISRLGLAITTLVGSIGARTVLAAARRELLPPAAPQQPSLPPLRCPPGGPRTGYRVPNRPNRKENPMEKTQIKTTQLGSTGLEITRVGFGAWAIGGGGYDWGWGSQEDDDSVATIQHALELGLNRIDTPAQYGFGHSEEVVGRVIAGLHERPYLFTKGGQPEGPARTTLQSLRRDSLRRELWTLRNPAVDGAIAGFRRRDQVDPIVAAANLELGERHRDDRRESMK